MLSKKKFFIGYLFVCSLMIFSFGCSDDTEPSGKDGGTSDKGGDAPKTTDGTHVSEGGTDGSEIFLDCTGKDDGTSCAASGDPGFICLNGECKASTCGDKYVDTSLEEECDDGNQDPSDGCSACHWICKENSNCADGETCNGDETCNTSTHLCQPGTLQPNSTACKMSGSADGECNGGVCGPAGCGNGVKAGTEECDDGNQVNGDGCNNDCTFSCDENTDCDDGDACNGVESCKKETDKQYCEAGVAPTCDDSKDCTTDSCDPATGCVHTPIDGDGDGKSCDDDCNDGDAYVYVGAPECVDGKDNDCDNQVDEAPTAENVTCWQDMDKDGFSHVGAATQTKFCGSPCDTGYTALDPSVAGQKDCAPCVSSAYPGQTDWFTKDHCTTKTCTMLCKKGTGTFDYDCDGVEKQHWTTLAKSTCSLKSSGSYGFCSGSGWVGSVPACGAVGVFQTCTYNSTVKNCLPSQQPRTQECH